MFIWITCYSCQAFILHAFSEHDEPIGFQEANYTPPLRNSADARAFTMILLRASRFWWVDGSRPYKEPLHDNFVSIRVCISVMCTKRSTTQGA